MIPCRYDFLLPTNGDYVEEINFVHNGDPINLSGTTFGAQVRSAFDSPTILLTLLTVSHSYEQGFAILEPQSGIMQLRVNREAAAALYAAVVPSAYNGQTVNLPYDALATLPNGDIEQWFFGYMVVRKGVTA